MNDVESNDRDGEPRLYTAEQAAALLQVSPSWLRKRATARAIPCTFVGKHLRFSMNDLAMIIAAGAYTPPGQPRQ
jgi:excisionase family DNA binding protein